MVNSTDGIAVLLIDMIPYFTKEMKRAEFRRLVLGQRKVLEECDNRDVPVAIIEWDGRGSTISQLKPNLSNIRRKSVVKKNYVDSFSETDLDEVLRAWEIREVCLTGICASACVLRTAYGALSAGYNVSTSGDLLGFERGLDSQERGILLKEYQRLGYFAPTVHRFLELWR